MSCIRRTRERPTPAHVALALVIWVVVTPAGRGDTRPSQFEWERTTPEAQGMSSQKLEALREGLAARHTRAFVVIRNDRIVAEWYAPGQSATRPQGTASLAKALVGGLSLAVAMSDDRVALDDPAMKFIPQWKDDSRKSRITIRQLGSHTSGLADAEAGGKRHEELTGWAGDFWKRLDPPNDPFTIARDRTPVIFDPGTSRQYSNPGIAMLSYAVAGALRDAPVNNIRTLLRDRVMRPIGVRDDEWSCGYGKTVLVDGLPLIGSWGGASFTARASARIGRLMLREGDWDGQQVLARAAVRQTTGSSGLPGAGGMGWWTNANGRCSALPADAYWGAGAGGQVLLVVPSLKLVVVRNGDRFDSGDNNASIYKHLFTPLMDMFEKGSAAGAND